MQLACAWWLWRGGGLARPAAHLLLAGTLAWAIWETRGHGWGMVSRLFWPLLIWLLVLLATRKRAKTVSGRIVPSATAAAAVLIGSALLIGRLFADQQASTQQTPAPTDFDWHEYGRTLAATRFSPLTQITPDNVSQLEVAWSYRTGDMPRASDAGMEFTFEATPLKIGRQLFLCTPHNIVIALDAETGRERWRFDPRVEDKYSYVKACRGVSYFKATGPVADCPERILSGTLDGRLLALDAQTGKPCAGFGQEGQISVLRGLGSPPPGFAYLTSAPLIVGGLAVVGGWVLDGWSTGMPSGAVRAYDAVTGQFAWAWDMGRPGDPSEPPPGQSFTPGTPNVWAPMSADPSSGSSICRRATQHRTSGAGTAAR